MKYPLSKSKMSSEKTTRQSRYIAADQSHALHSDIYRERKTSVTFFFEQNPNESLFQVQSISLGLT